MKKGRKYGDKVKAGECPSYYSEEYRAWKRAVLKGPDGAVKRAHDIWMKRFNRRSTARVYFG